MSDASEPPGPRDTPSAAAPPKGVQGTSALDRGAPTEPAHGESESFAWRLVKALTAIFVGLVGLAITGVVLIGGLVVVTCSK